MRSDVSTLRQSFDATVKESHYRCLGVIIPVYNEARTVEQILQRVLDQACVLEVIVVDDASTDGSLDLVKTFLQRDSRVRMVSHERNRGKGAAIRTGLALAVSDIIIIQDADLEYNPGDYKNMLELIQKGEADVVYGSRFSGIDNSGNPFWHKVGNKCLTWCSNVASGLRLTDEATCYKMFPRDILRKLELVEDRFGFCPEFTAKISNLGLKIREFPISYRARTRAEGKKIRLKDGFSALSCIIKYNYFPRGVRQLVIPQLIRSPWMTVIQALVYSFLLLFLTEAIPSCGNWYSSSKPFRRQTEALLRGELALSHNIGDLEDDFCWANGGVHQVCGLGVPLWRLPFEALAKICRYNAFPDRIALGLFIALAAFVVFRTWLCPMLNVSFATVPGDPKAYWRVAFLGIGSLEFILFFPPIINVLSTRMFVYEEVMVYVYFYATTLACGIVALTRKPGWPRFWVLCCLAGFGGLIRPTLIFYGAATIIVGGMIMWSKEVENRSILSRRLLLGAFLFCSGGGLLFLTNLMRFGSGFEFGHRLNLQGGDLIPSVYSTRFDYPYAVETLDSAGRELFGALFQATQFNGSYYEKAFFPGQSRTFRWREFDFTTYDISYAFVFIALSLIANWNLWKWKRFLKFQLGKSTFLNSSKSPVTTLVLWGSISCIITAAFYLRTPAIASRYMLDFAPGFVAVLIGLWNSVVFALTSRVHIAKIPVWISLMLLLIWQGAEMMLARNALGRPASVTYEQLVSNDGIDDLQQLSFPPTGSWTAASARASKIPFNGNGWDSGTANTKAAIELFIKDPRCLNVEVEPRSSMFKMQDYECIQAKIGLEFLQRKNITALTNGARIEFKPPKRKQYQIGIQPLFLAMVSPSNLGTNDSQFRLLKVNWNEN